MATQSKVTRVTASRCTTEAEMGTHTFEIVGYSLKKGMGIGNFVQSATFTVGDHSWAIRFYPDGMDQETRKYASVALVLMDKDAKVREDPIAKVRAFYDLFLVNQIKCRSESIVPAHAMFVKSTATVFRPRSHLVERKTKLEPPSNGYIRNDRMTIQCDLTVVRDPELCKTKGGLEIQVPPSDLAEQFGRLLLEEEETDVVFSVGGETFPAHKVVLATRSPVFKAQLYGNMKEAKARRMSVTVEDMQPGVFRTLLKFIYTDTLPDIGDDNICDDDDYNEIIRHLLVAADRYAMDRLKLLCASVLVEHLRVETVATTLTLADQHNCESLRDVCVEFMASSDQMRAVVATQGYANAKRTCPSVIFDALEKTSRCRKM